MSRKPAMMNFGNTKASDKKGKKKSLRELQDLVVENIDEKVQSQQQIVSIRRRLRRNVDIDSDDGNRQKIIPAQQQQQQLSDSQQKQKKQQKFQRYQLLDDKQLQQQQHNKKQQKKKSKLPQNNRNIKQFIKDQNKQKKQNKPIKNKQNKPNSQLLLFQSFNRVKPIPRKKSFDDFVVSDKQDNQNDDSDSQMLNARVRAAQKTVNDINGDLDQNQCFKIAMQLSLQEQKQKKYDLDQYAMTASQASKQNPYNNHNNNVENWKQKSDKKTAESKATTMKQSVQRHKIVNNKQVDKGKKSIEKVKKSQKKRQKPQKIQGPFSGHTIATTGQFQPYKKQQIVELLKSMGAHISTTSGKLPKKIDELLQGAYVVGDYNRRTNQDVSTTNKSKDALERRIAIIKNSQLDSFFEKYTGKTLTEHIEEGRKASQQYKIEFKKKMQIQIKNQKQGIHVQDQEDPILKSLPWTEKYKPTYLQEIIGQQSQIKSLKQWLSNWEDIHLRGNKKQIKNKGYNSGDINSKAALLSGDPGLGKTTTARLLAVQLNYDVVEFNASDIRNKSSILNLQSDSYGLGLARNLQKSLIIMDQVDGMSSGDRGGITAIIMMIKSTKIPIICICNDRQSEKIRSLANHCNDIRFHKPDKRMIVKRLQQILKKQKAQATQKALERIVQIFQNDVRKILSYLEIFVRTYSKNITIQMIQNESAQSKDSTVMVNPFQAIRKLMNRNGMNLRQKLDCFFVDSSLTPLLVHQNYLSSTQKKMMNRNQFHRLVQATESFVISDILDKKIRKEQSYQLMPSFGIMCCLYPIEKVSESIGFPQFPSFLGKFSSEKKNRRLIRQLKLAISPMATVTNSSTKFPYSTMLFKTIHSQLLQDNVEGVLDFMQLYNINPAILNQHLVSLEYNPHKFNLLADISTSTKTKMTKIYNKRHQMTKLKTVKNKQKIQHTKFNQVLQEEQQDNIDQEQQIQQEVIVQDKKKKKK